MWLDSFIDLIVFEPIYDLALPAQHRQPLDVGETLPMQVSQGLFHVREINDLSAQARELVEQRPFSDGIVYDTPLGNQKLVYLFKFNVFLW